MVLQVITLYSGNMTRLTDSTWAIYIYYISISMYITKASKIGKQMQGSTLTLAR